MYIYNQHAFQLESNGSVCAWHDSSYGIDGNFETGVRVCSGDLRQDMQTWTHLAVTFDFETKVMNLYKNGIIQSSTVDKCMQFNRLGKSRQSNSTIPVLLLYNSIDPVCQLCSVFNCRVVDYTNSTCFQGSSLGFSIIQNPFIQFNLPFIGAIYQVNVWNNALSNAQIMQLFNKVQQ